MIKRILIYGYPFFLILVEYVLRQLLKLESVVFIGPTLAAVGVSFLLPLIVPQKRDFPLSQKKLQKIQSKGWSLISTDESDFIDVVWILILALTTLWIFSLYLSCQQQVELWWHLPKYLIGVVNYFIGVTLSEIKERAFK